MSGQAWRGNGPIQAISLDLDDTLWPVLPALLNAESRLAGWLSQAAPATADSLTPDHRKRLRDTVVQRHPDRAHDMSFIRLQLLRDALVAAGDDASLAEQAFDVFLTARQEVTFFDDVLPVLEQWQSRYRLIAITNGNADLDRIGIGQWFSAKISAHEQGYAKPDSRIFRDACEAAGVSPANTLHIGDDHHLDYRAAHEAGLQAAWLRRPELSGGDKPVKSGVGQPPAPAETPFVCLRDIDRRLSAAG